MTLPSGSEYARTPSGIEVRSVPAPAPSDEAGPAAASLHPLRFWLPLAALSIITLLIQGCTVMALGVYLSPVAQQLGPIGSAATLFLLSMSLINLPVGWALQRWPARAVIRIGILLTALGCLGASFAQDRLLLALALALAGAGVGAATLVPGIAIITRHHADRRSVPLAIFLGASVVAGAVIPPLVGFVISGWGWRLAFLGSGIAVALICAPLTLLIPQGNAGRERRTTTRGNMLKAARHNHAFHRLAIAMTLIQLAINGILFSAVDSLMAQGLSQSGAVGAYSIANLLGLPALLVGGIVADRMGARAALCGAALLLAVGSAALLAAQAMGMAGVVAFVLLWGIASALPGQSGSMLLADVTRADDFAGLLGLNSAIISLVGALAPAWTDQLRAWSGGFDLPIWIYAALALIAAPLVASVRIGRSEA